MDRRKFLKRASLFGAGAIAFSLPFGTWAGAMDRQYFLITDRPDSDTRRLLHMTGMRSGAGIRVEATPIQASAQDLSLTSGGRVVDPRRDPNISGTLRQFAFELQNRTTPAQTMVSISDDANRLKNAAAFEVNGQVVEQVGFDREYSSIVIPGEQGKTIFQVRNGQLSVVTSSCRHHLCKKMGALRQGRIICAPNKLVASVSSGLKHLDGITG